MCLGSVLLFILGRKLFIILSQRWKVFKENQKHRQQAQMTGYQLEGLIRLYSGNASPEVVDTMQSIMRSTLPDLLIPYENITLEDVIGKGGSGVVMSGRMGRRTRVALKVVQSQMAGSFDEIQ